MAAGVLESVRPTVVEHILALAVGFQIDRNGADQPTRVVF